MMDLNQSMHPRYEFGTVDFMNNHTLNVAREANGTFWFQANEWLRILKYKEYGRAVKRQDHNGSKIIYLRINGACVDRIFINLETLKKILYSNRKKYHPGIEQWMKKTIIPWFTKLQEDFIPIQEHPMIPAPKNPWSQQARTTPDQAI